MGFPVLHTKASRRTGVSKSLRGCLRSGLLLLVLLLLLQVAAAAGAAADGSGGGTQVVVSAYDSEQDEEEISNTAAAAGAAGGAGAGDAAAEDSSNPSSPAAAVAARAAGNTGFVYFEDSTDEDASDVDDEYDSSGSIEGSIEEAGWMHSFNPALLRPQVSMQVVLWLVLSAAIYLIMRGASREDEKQKSLDIHKTLLNNTKRKLEADKAAAAALERDIAAAVDNKKQLQKRLSAAEERLQVLVQDLQTAAGALDLEGGCRPRKMRALQQQQQQQQQTKSAATTIIGVPTHDNTSKEISKNLQLLLLHQGDPEYNEDVAKRSLESLLQQKQQMQQQMQQQQKHLPAQQQLMPHSKFLQALSWFEQTAADWGIYPDDAAAAGGGAAAAAADERTRERAVALLAATGLMLGRWLQLEGEVSAAGEVLQQLQQQRRQQAAAVSTRADKLLQELKTTSRATIGWQQQLRSFLSEDTEEERRLTAVADSIAATLQHLVNLFAHRACLTPLQEPMGAASSAVAAAAAAAAAGEAADGPSEAAEKVLLGLQRVCVAIVQETASFNAAADVIKDADKKQERLHAANERLVARLIEVTAFLGRFKQEHVVAEVQQQMSSIAAAGSIERHRILSSMRDQTSTWLKNVQRTFSSSNGSSTSSSTGLASSSASSWIGGAS